MSTVSNESSLRFTQADANFVRTGMDETAIECCLTAKGQGFPQLNNAPNYRFLRLFFFLKYETECNNHRRNRRYSSASNAKKSKPSQSVHITSQALAGPPSPYCLDTTHPYRIFLATPRQSRSTVDPTPVRLTFLVLQTFQRPYSQAENYSKYRPINRSIHYDKTV